MPPTGLFMIVLMSSDGSNVQIRTTITNHELSYNYFLHDRENLQAACLQQTKSLCINGGLVEHT